MTQVLLGAVVSIADHLAQRQLPAEASAPDEVEHGMILRHLAGGDPGAQNDPTLAAIKGDVYAAADTGCV